MSVLSAQTVGPKMEQNYNMENHFLTVTNKNTTKRLILKIFKAHSH